MGEQDPNHIREADVDELAATRSGALPEDSGEDPDTQARTILEESEERVSDPATQTLDDDTVERRRVDDLVSDPETREG